MTDLRNTPQGNYWLARAIERRASGPSGPDVVVLPKGTPVKVGPPAAENPDLVSAWIGPLFTSLDPEDLTAEPQDLEEQDAEEGIPEMTERVRVAYEGLNATLLEDERPWSKKCSVWVTTGPLGTQRRVGVGETPRQALQKALDEAPSPRASTVATSIAEVLRDMLEDDMLGDKDIDKLRLLVGMWERARAAEQASA